MKTKLLTICLLLFSFQSNAQSYENDDFKLGTNKFKLLPSKFEHTGYAFKCIPCKADIGLQITYGESNNKITNQYILDILKLTSSEKEKFAIDMVKKSFEENIPISIQRQIGNPEIVIHRYDENSEALERIDYWGVLGIHFLASLYIGDNLAFEDTSVFIHKNRIGVIRINYFDGDIDFTTGNAIKDFMHTLEFKK